MKSRHFAWTMNNPGPDTEAAVIAIDCKFATFGREVGESGTPHLQGMTSFEHARSLSAIIKLLQKAHPGTHVEICRDAYKSMVYCQKDGDTWQTGTMPKKPADGGGMERDRWKRAYEMAAEGNLEDIDADIKLRFYGTLKKIKEDHQVTPTSLPTLDFHWYQGSSGSGKSKFAHDENPGYYLKSPNKWWDQYEPGQTVIIDEWDPNHKVLASHLKKWADHHPFAAEIKGGTRMLRPPKLIITSNYTIKECFPQENDHLPLLRRFTVKQFGEPQPAGSFDAQSYFGGTFSL
ncbi:hypothetical protein [uncultured marine virus]|nr:hypothetical protein [uncultured marine virus]